MAAYSSAYVAPGVVVVAGAGAAGGHHAGAWNSDLFAASPFPEVDLLSFFDSVAHESPVDVEEMIAAVVSSASSERADSSASSPSSVATGAPEVPVFEAPALSPPCVAPTTYVDTKNEMIAASPDGLPQAAEIAPAASKKRKNSTSSSQKEADSKAAAVAVAAAASPVVHQMSKRARANERNRKREAHNQAERERRDDMKEGFAGLRTVLPTSLCPDRKNMVELLQATIKYIGDLQKEGERLQKELSDLRGQSPSSAPMY